MKVWATEVRSQRMLVYPGSTQSSNIHVKHDFLNFTLYACNCNYAHYFIYLMPFVLVETDIGGPWSSIMWLAIDIYIFISGPGDCLKDKLIASGWALSCQVLLNIMQSWIFVSFMTCGLVADMNYYWLDSISSLQHSSQVSSDWVVFSFSISLCKYIILLSLFFLLGLSSFSLFHSISLSLSPSLFISHYLFPPSPLFSQSLWHLPSFHFSHFSFFLNLSLFNVSISLSLTHNMIWHIRTSTTWLYESNIHL